MTRRQEAPSYPFLQLAMALSYVAAFILVVVGFGGAIALGKNEQLGAAYAFGFLAACMFFALQALAVASMIRLMLDVANYTRWLVDRT